MRIAIIGAGPIGLYIAGKLEQAGIDYLIFEATDKVGGQLNLYANKDIVDIDGFESIKAKDYIDFLVSKIDKNKVVFNKTIKFFGIFFEHKLIIDDNPDFVFDRVIYTKGLGIYEPRKLGLEDEDKYKNILYTLDGDYSFLKDKNVVIFGGGDSALDWAKQLSHISNVFLVHRRDTFRGNAKTLEHCPVVVFLSYIPYKLVDGGIQIQSVVDKSVSQLDADYIIVNFGGQINKEDLVSVDADLQVSTSFYAAGDCCNYDGKIRRIMPGIKEADKILKDIAKLTDRNI